MDIIDILLARKAAQGQAATIMTQAQAALQEASDAADSITSMSSAIETYGEQAQSAYERATAAADIYDNLIAITDQSIIADLAALLSEQMLDTTIAGIEVANSTVEGAVTKNIIATKYGGNTTTLEVERNYTTTGQNTDGSMTQKAITDALQSAQVNLGSSNSDKLVKVGSNGELVVSSIDEDDILNGNIHVDPTNPDTPQNPIIPPSIVNNGTLGIKINYITGVVTPTDDNTNIGTTQLFNQYNMYGGRKRCIVDNSGAIIAFYGEQNYNEQQNNGYQVMVYQPKFYYKRTPIDTTQTVNGIKINEEVIKVSDVKKEGFKIHPLFVDENNNELSYVLLSAYEGSIEDANSNDSYKNIVYNNFTNKKLSSVINAQPITGQYNNLNLVNAERLAHNRGDEWHITNIEALSAEQLLEMIEFNNLNGQSSFYPGLTGVIYGTVQNHNKAKTGATTSLGNTSGRANYTIITNETGDSTTLSSDNTTSITYRGLENFWGNQWKIINGITCKTVDNINTNEIYVTHNSNDTHLSFTMPADTGWISQFGYDENCDWVFLPIECGQDANSLGPIGDLYYNIVNEKNKILLHGGMYFQGSQAGLFNYLTQYNNTDKLVRTTARLLYIPSISNENYTTNISKWVTTMGG